MPYNPGVVDRSGEIWANAIGGIGRTFSGAIDRIHQDQQENDYYDAILNGGGRAGGISDAQNRQIMAESGPGLGQFQPTATPAEGPDAGTGEGAVSNIGAWGMNGGAVSGVGEDPGNEVGADRWRPLATASKGLDGFLTGIHGVSKDQLATMSLGAKRGLARKMEMDAMQQEQASKIDLQQSQIAAENSKVGYYKSQQDQMDWANSQARQSAANRARYNQDIGAIMNGGPMGADFDPSKAVLRVPDTSEVLGAAARSNQLTPEELRRIMESDALGNDAENPVVTEPVPGTNQVVVRRKRGNQFQLAPKTLDNPGQLVPLTAPDGSVKGYGVPNPKGGVTPQPSLTPVKAPTVAPVQGAIPGTVMVTDGKGQAHIVRGQPIAPDISSDYQTSKAILEQLQTLKKRGVARVDIDPATGEVTEVGKGKGFFGIGTPTEQAIRTHLNKVTALRNANPGLIQGAPGPEGDEGGGIKPAPGVIEHSHADVLKQAKAAIAAGKDPAAVATRLRQMGIDPALLNQ